MTLELDYGNFHGQESMLKDAVRCDAFRTAIAEVVAPGCAVLDVGAGTGLLSLFAAQAGAGSVVAVERTPIAEFARALIAANGVADQVQVIHGDISDVELPCRVDVIVSEWLGGYALDENLLPIVVQARDRWLKPGGIMIPGRVSSMIVPAYDESHQQDVDFWRSYPYGIDLDVISRRRVGTSYSARHDLTPERLPCAPQTMWTVDCQTCSQEQADGVFDVALTFVAEADATINCLAAWFSAQLSAHTVLSNSPQDPDTHWGRSVFPVGDAIQVRRGESMQVTFRHEPLAPGQSQASWTFVAGDYEFQSSDATVLI